MRSKFFLSLACWLAFSAEVIAQPAARTAFPAIRLPAKVQGETAINVLSNQLPAIAAYYRKTPQELRDLLRRDRSLWVDRDGRLLYVCDLGIPPAGLPAIDNIPTPGEQLQPLDQTFHLHSKPGSNRIIYLDFVGFTISGTAWNVDYNGGADIVAPPFDVDGDPTTFNSGELTGIQQIWLRVAEDYSPYDVDVTTEYPGEDALTRSSIGDQAFGVRALVSAISTYFGNYGGIAYLNAYDEVGDFHKPALIFPENLGYNEKYIAEALSHEVGHYLGLTHDGQTNGATLVEYYLGQGNWAPIMGAGYYHPISQWSRGEYTNANNAEDDLTVITQNGLNYRVDDFGNSIGTATPLFGVSILTNGIIEQTNDVDFFSFHTGAGTAQITATPSERGANLHILLSLYDGAGVLLTNTDAADTANGVQPVVITRQLNSGNYFVSVEGSGSGNPVTDGYSRYGSLGQYSLAIALPATGSWLPTPGGAFSWTNGANWVAGTIPDAVDITASINNNIVGNQSVNLDAPITIGRLLLGDVDASHGFTIQDGAGGPLSFNVTSGTAAILKAAGANDLIAATLSLQDDVLVSNSSPATLTLSGSIGGAGGLTKSGAGLVTIAGTNSYAGNTTIAGGVLALDSTALLPVNGTVDVRSGASLDVTAFGGFAVKTGQTLGGRGAVLGDVVVNAGGNLSPGLSNAPGTITFSNNLTFSGGGLWTIDLSGTNTTGSGSNDLAIVTGNLSLAGLNMILVNPLASTLSSPATYTILNYGGALSGSAAANLAVGNPTRYAIAADDSVPGRINLNVSGGPTNILWRGDGALNLWDVATSFNWMNGSSSDRYYQLDSVTFDNTGSNNTPISLVGNIAPTAVTINATKAYTFTGPGKFTGPMSLTMFGDGGLILSNANDFTGPITMNLGTLKPAVSNALGSSVGGTFIQGGGQLDVNGLNLADEPVTVQAGSPSGSIVNSGAPQLNALRFVTLSGDTFFGGTSRWDIRANPTASLTGNGFKLSKAGTNEIWLVDLGNTGLGNIDVRQGLLGIQASTTLGNPASMVTLFPGTTLLFWDTSANVLNKVLLMTNATVRNDYGYNAFAGPVTLNNSNTFNIVSSLDLRGPISGNGQLFKTGSGLLTLSGSNMFTGIVYVDTGSTTSSDGLLKLAGSNALPNASSIFIRNSTNGSSTLQLDGTTGNLNVPAAITLSGRNIPSPAIQHLAGSNTLSGSITLQNGGSNYWFESDDGTLALTAAAIPSGSLGGLHTLIFQSYADTLVSGIIQNAGGTVAITKEDPGRLILAGNCTYTGTNTINFGTFQIGNGGAGAKPGPGPFVINTGFLQFNRSDDFTWNNDVSGPNGQLIKLNTNTMTLTSTNSYLMSVSVGAQVNGGTLLINAPGLLIANGGLWIAQNVSTGACVVNTGTLIVSNAIAVGRNNGAANGTLTINFGSVQKSGPGNITVGALNGNGTLTVNGGSLINNGQLVLAEGAGGGLFNLNGGVVQASLLTGFGSALAVARFNGGTLQATTNNPTFIVNLGQALVQSGGFILDDGGYAVTNFQALLQDATSPGGGFTKKGAGIVGLNSANTFRGDSRINAGVLRLVNGAALQFSTLNLAPTDSGTLSFGSLTAATLGGLSGSRGLALSNDFATAVALSVGNNTSNTAYTGILSGNGSVNKIGPGTLTLSGTNNYSGITTVSSGVLLVHRTLGPGAVSVTGGVLGGNGTLAGAVTVQPGGTLSPGSSIGVLTISNSVNLTGTTFMEITHVGPTNDALNVSGTLMRGGALIVTNIGPALVAGDTFPLFNAASFAGSFANLTLPALNSGLRWNTNLFATTGVISVANITAPQIRPSLNGTNFVVQFPTEAGVTYVLQATPTLYTPITWTPQRTNSGDGTFQSMSIPIDPAQSQRYFRLQAF